MKQRQLRTALRIYIFEYIYNQHIAEETRNALPQVGRRNLSDFHEDMCGLHAE